MTLSVGDKLDHFEILSLVGTGGMGEVYKARDTHLNRTVAIKLSKSEFSERFEREAKAVAALNHPHICQIYEVGKNYIVMEFVEGLPLKGPLPLAKTLEYAAQIAAALDHAHTRGITHRDLKPANILLGKAGVKLLDFGLAKMTDAPSADGSTVTIAMTKVGEVMGTLAYMAPEQLEGKEADARADIYALGLVLYEIATGKRAYPYTDVQTLEPPALQKVFRRAIETDPEKRWQSARDFGHALELVQAPSSVAAPPPTKPVAWIGAAVAALIIAVAFAVLYFRSGTTPEEPVAKLSVLSPPNTNLMSEYAPAISPDGTKLAFLARDGSGKSMLWVRPLDSLRAQPLAGTEDAQNPFWSPDSRSIAFLVAVRLQRVELAGGAPRIVCQSPVARGSFGAAWSPTGVILMGGSGVGPLSRGTAAGGSCVEFTKLDRERMERGHAFPQFLPDGRHFLFLALSTKPENTGIRVGSLDSPESKFLMSTPSAAIFAPPGSLLFVRGSALMAQGLDLTKLALVGDPVTVADQIVVTPFGDAMFSVSSNGVLAYRSGSSTTSQLTWFDRAGKPLGTLGPPGDYVNTELSRDGKRAAFQRRSEQGDRDIWWMDVARGIPQRLTFSAADETNPVWSPDGNFIAFASVGGGAPGLFRKASSGLGSEELLFKPTGDSVPLDWSSDGRFLFFRMVNAKGFNEAWVLPMVGERKAFGYLQSDEFNQNLPHLSPNGRWLAYFTTGAGTSEIYLKGFPKPAGTWQVSTGGGSQYRWARDGNELFYSGPTGELVAVTVKGETAPEIGSPQVLFTPRVLGGSRLIQGYRTQYDVAPDGRFLVNVPVDEGAGSSMTVVLNWPAGLKK